MAGPFPKGASALLKDVRIVDCDAADWRNQILSHLGVQTGPQDVLSQLLTVAHTALGARSVVVEPYISTDWADEYQASYSRMFKDISRTSVRLHFFGGLGKNRRGIQIQELFNMPQSARKAYLGYAVIRPFEPVTVGEAVLGDPFEGSPGIFVPCKAAFRTHLLGHELEVVGMPFMQQEEAVAVCAGADMWMLARYKNARGEARRFRPSEVQSIATRNFGFGPTRQGLLGEQMYHALREMDLNPDIQRPRNASDAVRLLYSYVSSEIPVIAALQGAESGHVVTVIGCRYSETPSGLLEDASTTAAYVDGFVIHDDQAAPYKIAKVGKATDETGIERLTLDGLPVYWCLMPIPHRVHLREEDIRGLVEFWLRRYLTDLPGDAVPPEYWTQAELNGLVTRFYLQRADRYKMEAAPVNAQKQARSIEAVAHIWAMSLPRWIWVVELLDKKSLKMNAPAQNLAVGELIFDSTCHLRDVYNALLAVHLNGRLLYRGRKTVGPPPSGLTDARTWLYVDKLPHGRFSSKLSSMKHR